MLHKDVLLGGIDTFRQILLEPINVGYTGVTCLLNPLFINEGILWKSVLIVHGSVHTYIGPKPTTKYTCIWIDLILIPCSQFFVHKRHKHK